MLAQVRLPSLLAASGFSILSFPKPREIPTPKKERESIPRAFPVLSCGREFPSSHQCPARQCDARPGPLLHTCSRRPGLSSHGHGEFLSQDFPIYRSPPPIVEDLEYLLIPSCGGITSCSPVVPWSSIFAWLYSGLGLELIWQLASEELAGLAGQVH